MKNLKSSWAITALFFVGLTFVAVKVSQAATASGSLAVSATVSGSCTVGTSTVPFGNFTGTAVNTTGSISVNCTNGMPYSVDLGAGLNFSAPHRQMLGTGVMVPNLLSYDLYQDAGHTILFGTGAGMGGTAKAGTGSGASQSISVFGVIPTQTAPNAGSYADTVGITVTF